MKRILTMLLIVTLTVSGVAGLLTTPAAARIYSVQPTNEDGGVPTDQFTTADPIFAVFRADLEGGTICVIDKDGDESHCKTIANYIGTGWSFIAPGLEPGVYRLRADDPGFSIDSVPFTVTDCTAPDCAERRRMSDAVVAEWKQAAADMHRALRRTSSALMFHSIGSGFITARGLITSSGVLTGTVEVLVTDAASLAIGFAVSTFNIPTTINPFIGLAKNVADGTAKMYKDIMDDPPDPDYATVAPPNFATLPGTGNAEHDRLALTLDRQRAFGRAQLKAYERYLGAVAAGDEVAVRLQAQAVADYGDHLVTEMRASADALRSWAAQLDPDRPVISQSGLDDAQSIYERVRADGFTQDEINQLTTLGLSSEQIEQVRRVFDEEISQTPVGVSLQRLVNDAAAAIEGNIQAVNTFSREAGWVAGGRSPKTITLAPASMTLPVGATHTVSASVTDRRGAPVAGVSVSLNVAGANPATLSATTNAGGVAKFSYVGNNQGVDTLSATAGSVASGQATVTWSVGTPNAAPSVRAYNESPEEGSNGQFQFDFSDADTQDTHTATIDWGDGSPADLYSSVSGSAGFIRESNGSGFIIGYHVYAESGVYSAKGTVTDNHGAAGVGVSTVNVRNLAPVLGNITLEKVNGEVSVNAGFTDRGVKDTHTAVLNWGDGTTSPGAVTEAGGAGSASGRHVYGQPGHYTLTLTIADDDGGTVSRQIGFTVGDGESGNSSPSVHLSNYTTFEGSGHFAAQFTDRDTLDVHTALIDWGDGSPVEPLSVNDNGGSGSIFGFHTYLDNGTFNLTVSVRDNRGGVDTKTTTMTVQNAAPRVNQINRSGSLSAPGDAVMVNSTFSDPGVSDTHTAVWDWGDGTTSPATLSEANGSGYTSGEHVYHTVGVYRITLTVTDNDRASGSSEAAPVGVYAAKITTGSIQPVVVETGRLAVSIGGRGIQGQTGVVQVEKPARATVRGAYFAAATTGFHQYLLGPEDIKLEDAAPTWNVVTPNSIYAYNYWADVTSIVKDRLDAAPAGRIDLSFSEPQSFHVDGIVLVVIFDDPNQTKENTVALLFGAQQVAGDRFTLRFSQPINKSDPKFALTMSLGISFGFQMYGEQYSIVNVNGRRMTTSAGGEDDGEPANGSLLTVGGLGDNKANPPDPQAAPVSGARSDDELYDLEPFVNTGDTTVSVETHNPSNDDNIFFAALFLEGGTAVVGEGVLLTPVSAAHEVGARHTLTATAQDAQGKLLQGREVTVEILSGPHAGLTQSATTDAEGIAQVSYTGTRQGTDAIVARFVDSQGQVQMSNTVTAEWKSAAVAPTQLAVSTASGTYGETTKLSARLSAGDAPLNNARVSFSLNGTPVGVAATDADGVAVIPDVSLAGINAGLHPDAVAASFAGDASRAASNGTGDLKVDKATPRLNWDNPPDIVYGTALGGAQLNAAASVPGMFTYAPAAGTVLPAGGRQNLRVSFTPTDSVNYYPASKDVAINISKSPLNIIAGDQSKVYGTVNPPLTFTSAGFVNGDTAATAFNGAPLLVTTAHTGSDAGAYPITASNGTLSSANYAFTFVPGTLTINRAPTTTITDGKMFANNAASVLTASLLGLNSLPVANRSLTLTLGTGAGVQACVATTDAAGKASCRIDQVRQPLGTGTVSASFAGDANYLASTGNATTLIFDYPAGAGSGAFVIGDLNATVGEEVTFWGDRWAKLNALSGGAAPPGFKGFMTRSDASPPTCGGTWTTAPGNSSAPPRSVPEYMAVIASSSVTKSGSTITGNAPQIVIVRVNSGYSSNPGHAGTGTVVAVLCR